MEVNDSTNSNVETTINLNSPTHESITPGNESQQNANFGPRNPSIQDAQNFFAIRQGAFEKAVTECMPIILSNLDGELRGTYLLTEIDHWDVEKEKLVFLCDKTIIVIKYDFITLKLLNYKRIPLTQLDIITIGEIKYPTKSLAPKFSSGRNILGVRCTWNKGTPLKWLDNWNPWCKNIPWITFASHPLISHKESSSQNYSIESFADAIAKVAEKVTLSQEKVIQVSYQPIVVENYLGLASYLHNLVEVGFYKSHGKVSF